jgi:hypothetical protein
MKAKLLAKLESELLRYNKLRQELISINWIRNKKEVDRVVALLYESNKLIAQYRADYNEFMNSDLESLS